jgi:hypothetical protein
MNKKLIISLFSSFILSTNLLALECPKNITISFTSPKANETVNGAKQKVTLTTNVKEGLFYHLIQTNANDKKKTSYLQNSGVVDNLSISNNVWLGNDTLGKNSSFVITAIISTKLIPKEGKVAIWNETALKPNEICNKSSVTVNRAN